MHKEPLNDLDIIALVLEDENNFYMTWDNDGYIPSDVVGICMGEPYEENCGVPGHKVLASEWEDMADKDMILVTCRYL